MSIPVYAECYLNAAIAREVGRILAQKRSSLLLAVRHTAKLSRDRIVENMVRGRLEQGTPCTLLVIDYEEGLNRRYLERYVVNKLSDVKVIEESSYRVIVGELTGYLGRYVVVVFDPRPDDILETLLRGCGWRSNRIHDVMKRLKTKEAGGLFGRLYRSCREVRDFIEKVVEALERRI